MARAQNKLSYVAVSDALLTMWEDRDLLDRDRKFGKGSKGKGTKGAKKGKGFSNMALEEEDLEEESGDDPSWTGAQSWDTTPAAATLGDVMQALRDGYAEGWQEAATYHTVALTDPEVKEATEHMQAAEAMQMEANRTLMQARAAVSAARRDRGFGKGAGGFGHKGRGKRAFLVEDWSWQAPAVTSSSWYESQWQEPYYDDAYFAGKGKGK